MKAINETDLLNTLKPLGDVIASAEKVLKKVEKTQQLVEVERGLFRDIDLSNGMTEVIEKHHRKKVKAKNNADEDDEEDAKAFFFDMFRSDRDPIKVVRVANPLGPIMRLVETLEPEYRQLVDSLQVIKEVGQIGVVRNSIGTNMNVPIPKTLVDAKALIESGNINAIKGVTDATLNTAFNNGTFDEMNAAREFSVTANSYTTVYLDALKTAASTCVGMLNNIDRIEHAAHGVWIETEAAYKALSREYLHREANRVVQNPIITNVLKVVYNDLPGLDEIEDGANLRQITPYSVHQSERLLKALTSKEVYGYLKKPGTISSTIKNRLTELFGGYHELVETMTTLMLALRNLDMGKREQKDVEAFSKYRVSAAVRDFTESLESFDSVDFGSIRAKAKVKTKTKGKTHAQMAKYVKIAGMLDAIAAKPDTAKKYVLQIYGMHRRDRENALRRPDEKDDEEEPTFYEAQQSAWGAIELVPSKKPAIRFSDIIGESYKETKDHIDVLREYTKYPRLYLATSPSRTLKSNILLVGPPGSGKTEVFRAMASDPRSVVVSVSGANVLSMWFGQAEQNVVRLAKAAQKLHDKTGKIVYVAIDEIDSVLQDPSEGNNLGDVVRRIKNTFQEIMDGVRYYRGVVWCGATNHPELLDPAVMRRFSFVDAPGNLTMKDRATILKYYTALGLPLAKNITEKDFEEYAKLMDGAVGDTVRKISDGVHEKILSEFIKTNPKEAKELEKWLKKKDFNVWELTKRDRQHVKKVISQKMTVTKELLESTLKEKVKQPNIIREIEVAKKTFDAYKNAMAGYGKSISQYQ
ncbi:MAG: ATP-binding protein [Nitrososphaerota archaeon]|jgi:SpoVK/Ycf46/Vps4 family AAA+-type ATPase|nr:ATP-binding protein [Nitrososphaerota archaeon]MDG6948700.1 ATP-binding protein [Nitrososphaerota archaeon]